MVKLFDNMAEPSSAARAHELAPQRALPALLTAALIFLSGLGGMAYLDQVNLTRHQEAEAASVRAKLRLLQNRLETSLGQRLFLSHGLEALARSQPDISTADFEHVARIMLVGQTGVRGLMLAHNNTVGHIFPQESNRTSMGINLLNRPDQADAIREAVSKRKTILAGPFTLVQGGHAIATRTPIFIPATGVQTDYWGLVSVIIEVDSIFDEAGFRQASDRENIRVAAKGRDGKGSMGGMVWGEPTIFDEMPVTADMEVPGGKWRLAAIPHAGWSEDYPERQSFWGIGLGGLLASSLLSAIAVLAFHRFRGQFQGREAVKKELTESEERFRRLAEAAWEGLVIHDWAHIYDFNTRLVEMTGYAPEEIRRMSLLDLVVPQDREKLQRPNSDAGAGQHEISLRCKSGRNLIAETRGADLFFRGQVLHVTSLRDITQTKEAEKALVMARDAAQMANRVKSEFLANMSHELRTPLNAILGFADIMEQELLGPLGAPRYKGYAHDIQVSANHLLAIINDILDISRVEAGTMDLYETRFEPTGVAHSCLRLLDARAAKNKCELILDLPEDPLPQILADERRMKQILLNLLSNAVKFTPEGGSITLRLRLMADGGLLFAVQDTGIGMSTEDMQKALTPFMQVDSGMNRKQEGTGLGLPLAKNMIEMHGASMSLESEPQKGTTVSFTLPPNRVVKHPNEGSQWKIQEK
jgi:PAS domain S-box-containing protein